MCSLSISKQALFNQKKNLVDELQKQSKAIRRKTRKNHHKNVQQNWEEENLSKEYQMDYDLVPFTIKAKPKIQEQRSLTQAKKKQKQNKMFYGQQNNIFKQNSDQAILRVSKEDIRLPVLEKRRNEMQDPQGRKVIRIPVDRLKRLPHQQVKRRFLMKYQFQHKEEQE